MELKFRAYDKKHKEMINVSMIDWKRETIDGNFLISASGKWGAGLEYPFSEINLMQYTGIKDKNGREIYEGDIVNVDSSFYGYWGDCFSEGGKFIVKYEEGEWILEDESEGYICSLQTANSRNAKIIGNIHENPKLLKEK